MLQLGDILALGFAFSIGIMTTWLAFPSQKSGGIFRWVVRSVGLIMKLIVTIILVTGLWVTYTPLFIRPLLVWRLAPILVAMLPAVIVVMSIVRERSRVTQ